MWLIDVCALYTDVYGSSSQYGSLLIPVIMSKLPPEIRIQVARNTAWEVWEMSDLLQVIWQNVEAREVSDSIKANVNLEKPKPNGNRPISSNLLSHDSMQPSPRVNQVKCVYCGGIHYSASCESLSDLQSCFEILKRDQNMFCLFQTWSSERLRWHQLSPMPWQPQ